MNSDLRTLIQDRLTSDDVLQKNWSRVLLAACEGREVLESCLRGEDVVDGTADDDPRASTRAGAFLASLSVQGFRGIGSKQTLTLTPGPGLTIVVGRNGSGKSSFAEALEVLFTGDSKRWSERSKIWKEGWRNLHHGHPAEIEAEVLLEGQGRATIACAWSQDGQLDSQTTYVQPKGKRKTTLQELGWPEALVSYRPFLSYNELSSMLDEGPSKLYDALSLVLGLEDLVNAQTVLSQSRLERQRAVDAADQVRKALIERINALLAQGADSRATACLDALTSKSWGITEVAAIVAAGTVPQPDHDTGALTRAAALESPDAERVRAAAASLRAVDVKWKAVVGSDAERSRQVADLLEAALSFHAEHGDADCPLCRTPGALSAEWVESSRLEIAHLREAAASSDQARQVADAALRAARALLAAPPPLLTQLFDIGLDGLDVLREEWPRWHAGATITQLTSLAEHLETRAEPFADALDAVRKTAAAELKRREDRWRPIADALTDWTELARGAKAVGEDVTRIKAAEAWLKDASADIRTERFAPIADRAMATWQYLRQQSNVELGRIELTGTKSQRRVSLDVTIDGVPGAALGVMSQGELHALALSLFLPRATLSESPFRFVVIDDPVQSMDPARVDGLAKALEDTARTRQVIVFTHDERLADAVRRLNIKSRILGVTRRAKSLVEVRTSLDPTRANIEDALALVHTTQLPADVLRRVVPGFCRAALEASFIDVFRRRRLTAGRLHGEVEDELRGASKLVPLAALVFFDDKDKGGDVMRRLNQFGTWAGDVFRQCNEGAHQAVADDLKLMIGDTERLAEKILEMK